MYVFAVPRVVGVPEMTESGVGLLVRLLEGLPARYVKALWLTEIEGRTVADVATILEESPEAGALLVHRAREGLRQAYLRDQPGEPKDPACAPRWRQLPAYVRGAGSVQAEQSLRAHMQACDDCRARMRTLVRAGSRIPVESALLELASGEARSYLAPLMGTGSGPGIVLGPLRFSR
jgi:hypothetical protein